MACTQFLLLFSVSAFVNWNLLAQVERQLKLALICIDCCAPTFGLSFILTLQQGDCVGKIQTFSLADGLVLSGVVYLIRSLSSSAGKRKAQFYVQFVYSVFDVF